jgi:hypothetical protein
MTYLYSDLKKLAVLLRKDQLYLSCKRERDFQYIVNSFFIQISHIQ